MFKFEQLSFGLSYHLAQEILDQPMVSSMTKHIFLPTQTYPYRLEAKSTLPVVTFKRLKTTTTSCSTGINLKYRNPLSHLFLPTKKNDYYIAWKAVETLLIVTFQRFSTDTISRLPKLSSNTEIRWRSNSTGQCENGWYDRRPSSLEPKLRMQSMNVHWQCKTFQRSW